MVGVNLRKKTSKPNPLNINIFIFLPQPLLFFRLLKKKKIYIYTKNGLVIN